MRNRKPRSSNKFLWFITGVLITLFVCGLFFLKKRVTIINEGQQGESITITNTKPIMPAPKTVTNTQVGTSNNHEQYDFYTMLPKMQVKQTTSTNSVATSSKPTKPLALAEQSMLAPQKSASAPAQTPVTNNAAPLANPTKFIVVAGIFNNLSSADALKAQLVLAGADPIKIQNISQNGTTKYRVAIGNTYSSRAEAEKMQQQMQGNSIDTKIQAIN